MFHLVSRSADGVVVTALADGPALVAASSSAEGRGTLSDPGVVVEAPDLASAMEIPALRPTRWVWDDTGSWYPKLLDAGIRVERSVDLRLSHAILRRSALAAGSELATAPPDAWDQGAPTESAGEGQPAGPALFDFDLGERMPDLVDNGSDAARVIAEFRRQQDAVRSSPDPRRLRLLLAAESAGALAAAEMQHAGLPWRADIHDGVLRELLGPRPPLGARPVLLEDLARRLRDTLDDERLNPDSAADVLRSLRRAGLAVTSTRSWELKKLEHPAIPLLLDYKKRSRLHTANGWAWMDAWIREGRFHPDYVPGGVVSGRWATRGGGALQLPKQLRCAVVADPGWKLVVADAAQLEPRILAGLSEDPAMAAAGRGKDLYQGIVESGAVETRPQAKVAMLGAMYGATTGESALLMPKLTRAYPKAIRLVEAAARAGERGEAVSSRLGRTSPVPGEAWIEVQGRASSAEATAADERRARSQARDWGRFTRNFVVQATAAEWALCWMAELRLRLLRLAEERGYERLESSPHLVYFLHDELMVHTPAQDADAVRLHIHEAARDAGRLLFGEFPVEFPVQSVIVDDYGQAKE